MEPKVSRTIPKVIVEEDETESARYYMLKAQCGSVEFMYT